MNLIQNKLQYCNLQNNPLLRKRRRRLRLKGYIYKNRNDYLLHHEQIRKSSHQYATSKQQLIEEEISSDVNDETIVVVIDEEQDEDIDDISIDDDDMTSITQIILLIMDPQSQSFEIVKLDFDSDTSKVSDIYTQIPNAATEHVLQTINYRAIIDIHGNELNSNSNLTEYVNDGDVGVFIAVSDNHLGSLIECARDAVPILTNVEARDMV